MLIMYIYINYVGQSERRIFALQDQILKTTYANIHSYLCLHFNNITVTISYLKIKVF
jgi:hypothetical protein